MIKEIRIKNYKSVEKLKLELGRVNVLIGENGCGKSNILEAIAMGGAAAADKLDHEFLATRGIRVTEPKWMRSGFEREKLEEDIYVYFDLGDDTKIEYNLKNQNKDFSKWLAELSHPFSEDSCYDENKEDTSEILLNEIMKISSQFEVDVNFLAKELIHRKELLNRIKKFLSNKDKNESKGADHVILVLLYSLLKKMGEQLPPSDFLIYSPENTALRVFEKEGQIEPLGINGEGLFKLIKVFASEGNEDKLQELKEHLQLIDWFENFDMPKDLFATETKLQITDKYLDENLKYFDQRSSNEGFLFLLFYFSLFISENTPEFFAVDNIDASLNPKLCRELIKVLTQLAKKYDKQVIFTTHNPAVLDGLDLHDEEQKLLVIYRDKAGRTKAKSVQKKETPEGQEPVKLSEAFLRGYIGGLPKNF